MQSKPCFSEPEEEAYGTYDETDDEYDEINDETNKINEINEINNETDGDDDEATNNINKAIISDEEHENDLRIILKSAIKNNDRELMICTMNLLRKYDEDKINTAITTPTTTYSKTPKWLLPLKCTINPGNNKKLSNQSFKYAIAVSRTSGDKRFRLTKIEKFILTTKKN